MSKIAKFSILLMIVFGVLSGCAGKSSFVDDWSSVRGVYYEGGVAAYGEIYSERFDDLGRVGVYVIRLAPGYAHINDSYISTIVELWMVSCGRKSYHIRDSYLFDNDGNVVERLRVNGAESPLKESNVLVKNACLGLPVDGKTFVGIGGFLSGV